MYLRIDNHFKEEPSVSLKRGNFYYNVLLITGILAFILTFLIFPIDENNRIYAVYIQPGEKPKFVTSEKFLSIALDTSCIADGFKNLNLSNTRFLKTVSALSPAYLRIGGNKADNLIFTLGGKPYKVYFNWEIDGGECTYNPDFCFMAPKINFTMSAVEWLKLNRVAEKTNMDLIFDINALRRFENGSWDSSNAKTLIEFSSNHNLNVNWELGNEPNAFRRQFNYEVSPEQLAKDFSTLKDMLNTYPKYKQSLLIGPDVTRPETTHNESVIYLQKFLQTKESNALDAITFHQYYFDGSLAKLEDFINPVHFATFEWQLSVIKTFVNKDKEVWLGETASAYGGGAPHLSDRYVASFLWLDKLGLSAKYGLSVVIRQSIARGNYALLTDSYTPTPDWWVSVLYKKLVSNKVVGCLTSQSPKVKLYCHCTKPAEYFQGVSSITVFGINIQKHKARIRFDGVASNNITATVNLKVYSYILTTIGALDSKFIYLNNVLLSLENTNDVPVFRPKLENAYPYVEMPPFSLAFWVIPVSDSVISFC